MPTYKAYFDYRVDDSCKIAYNSCCRFDAKNNEEARKIGPTMDQRKGWYMVELVRIITIK
jgi:hypothetical protein